ncbi:phage antirepressor KilAC domain-containing protein [Leucobacter sp. Z1108]|uniref:phage antirepressor KilAC domain-containing protein n=1 Tax=Leucobacter sp. Z1108 TaxID=3439066 RepID=UPI003F3B7B45
MSEVQSISPFERQLDELKIITLTDGEVWSARDLMPYAGYEQWRNWEKAIGRAIASVNASGLNANDHFVGVSKLIETGKGARREIEDLEITRYGAYILFQNADGSKPEVAAAQQYFAVKTREAEISPRATPTGAELLALAVIEAQAMLTAKDAQIAELTPRAAAWDDIASSDGDYSVGDAAKMLQRAGIETGRDRLFDTLRVFGWVYRQSGRLQAAQRAVDAGYLRHKAQSHRHPETDVIVLDPPQVRVTAKGIERLRVKMLPSVLSLTG